DRIRVVRTSMRPANIRLSVIGWDGVNALRSLMRAAANRSLNLGLSWSPAVDWNRGNTVEAAAFLATASSRAAGAGEKTKAGWAVVFRFRPKERATKLFIQLTAPPSTHAAVHFELSSVCAANES